jgi:hypothetical protein
MYQFGVSEAAWNDMDSSCKWYNDQQDGLGKEFLQEVFKTFQYIEKNPLLYAVRFSGQFRFAKVNRFPFLVVYEVLDKEIVINSVFHTYLNPNRLSG